MASSGSADRSASAPRGSTGVAGASDMDVRILQDPERFHEMTLGDQYNGKYRFLDVAQGEAEVKQLVHLRGRTETLAKECEGDLGEAEEKVEIIEEEYADLKEELDVKAASLREVKDKAEKLRGKLASRREYVREYDEAIKQAHKGLEVVRDTEVAYQRERGNKRRDRQAAAPPPKYGRNRESVVLTPRAGADRDVGTPPQAAPIQGVTSKAGAPSHTAVSRIGAGDVQEALRQQQSAGGKGDGRRASAADPKARPPRREYPRRCTLAVDGVPFQMSEKVFMPLLMTAFGHWEVGHQRIIGCNVLREASHISGTGTYVNRGQVMIRFSDREYLEEYRKQLQGRSLKCDVTGNRREIRVREPEQDLAVRPRQGRDVLTSARFFEEVWETYAVV